jgi:serine/threonine protein kinase
VTNRRISVEIALESRRPRSKNGMSVPFYRSRRHAAVGVVLLEVGAKLGPYRLMCLLGEGGVGMVFVDQHTILGHEVALKCMRPEYAQRQPKAKDRFFCEAKLAFSLRETNRDRIVKVTHVDEVGGVPYLIMER